MTSVKRLVQNTRNYYSKNWSDRFVQPVAVEEKELAIVYSRTGERLKDLTKSDTMQVLECVKELQKFNIIHRDLSIVHFLKCPKTKKVFLIDFGTAVITKSVDWLMYIVCYEGSVEFASMDILKHLQDVFSIK